MLFRRGLAVVSMLLFVAVGCSGSEGSEGAAPTDAEIPNQPAGLSGKEFCGQFSEELIVAAIDEPFRTYDAQPQNDFPAPGVVGYECQWEWLNPEGDQRNVKVIVLDFDGALEGSLDASFKGALDTIGPLGEPVENLGEEAVSVKLQGLSTIQAREGQRQVTVIGSSTGSVAPPTTASLALLGSEALEIGN